MREVFRGQASTSGVLLFGTVVGGVLAYLSIALSARVLGAAEFGLLGAMLGGVSLASVAVRPAYLLVTRLTARTRTRGDLQAVRDLATAAALFSIVVGLLLLAGTWLGLPALQQFFQTTEAGPLYAVALVIAGTMCAQFFTGFVSGLHRFTTVAFSTIAEALARLVVVFPLALLLGVTGSLLSYLVGLLMTIGIGVKSIGGLGRTIPPIRIDRGSLQLGGASASLTLTAALGQNLDLVLLRSYAPPIEVGLYAAAASLGNVLFALSAPLYLPAFPRSVTAHAEGKPTWPIVSEVLLLTGLICAVAVVASIVLGGSVTQILFGPTFSGAGLYVTAYLVKVTALLLFGILSQYALAIGAIGAIYVGSAVANGGPALLLVVHPTPLATALVIAASAAAGAFSIAIILWISNRARFATSRE
jgi:O-antigen/teichoic acid export membrane protein